MMKRSLKKAAAAALAAVVCLSTAGCGKGTAKEDERDLSLDFAVEETEEETTARMNEAESGMKRGAFVAEDGTIEINAVPDGYPKRVNGEYDDSYDPKCFGYNPADYVESVDLTGIILRDPGVEDVTEAKVKAKADELFKDYGTGTYESATSLAEVGKIADVDVTLVAEDGTKMRVRTRTRLGDGEIFETAEQAFDGLSAGDEIEPVTAVYPSDGELYPLRGKKVTATGTLLAVREFYSKTDESVAKITHQRYQSLNAYEKGVEERLKFEAEDDRNVALAQKAVNELVKRAKVKDLPKEPVAEALAAYKIEYEKELADGSMSEELLDFFAQADVLTEAVLLRVAQDEGIELTEEDCVEAAEYRRKVAKIESPEDWDAYLEKYGKRSVANDALFLKVSKAVLEKAKILQPLAMARRSIAGD